MRNQEGIFMKSLKSLFLKHPYITGSSAALLSTIGVFAVYRWTQGGYDIEITKDGFRQTKGYDKLIQTGDITSHEGKVKAIVTGQHAKIETKDINAGKDVILTASSDHSKKELKDTHSELGSPTTPTKKI